MKTGKKDERPANAHHFEVVLLLLGLQVATVILLFISSLAICSSGIFGTLKNCINTDSFLSFVQILGFLLGLVAWLLTGFFAVSKYDYPPERVVLYAMILAMIYSLNGYDGDVLNAAIWMIVVGVIAGICSYAGASFAKSRMRKNAGS